MFIRSREARRWSKDVRGGDVCWLAACWGLAVFIAALCAQALVITTWLSSDIGFLWYNVIGCGAVVVLALALNTVTAQRAQRL